ncbi:hypothetical protein OH76DRAFT_1487732 [Lentinus brumalis]|uniref:Uncharacterized protein n=1 Tax=Lentinus brumalis TaxID=2498619 RepID=A0A371CTG1_9APHY|nr:hypothetical protein OH76DRAFT_1487732 [Polyporus brumalis]
MAALPAATPAQIMEAAKVCSELHHSYYARPSTSLADEKNRRLWEYFFIRRIYHLSKMLTEARYEQLPPLAIACIYQSNIVAARQNASGESVKMDLEAIHPAGRETPNLDPGKDMRPLRYEATNDGQVALQPFSKEYRDFWKHEAIRAMQEKQGKGTPVATLPPQKAPVQGAPPTAGAAAAHHERPRDEVVDTADFRAAADPPTTSGSAVRRSTLLPYPGRPIEPETGTVVERNPVASTPIGTTIPKPGATGRESHPATARPTVTTPSHPPSTVSPAAAAAAGPAKIYPASKHARLTAAAKAKGKATDPIDVDSGDVELTYEPVKEPPSKPERGAGSSAMDVDPPRGRSTHRHSDIGPRTRSATRGESADAGSSAPQAARNVKRKSETPGPTSKKPRMEDGLAGDDGGTETAVPPEPGFPPEELPRTWVQHLSHCSTCAPGQCYFLPTSGAVCGPCQRKHSKCSLNMGVFQTSKAVTGYLSWRYSKQLEDPIKYPEPELLPTQFKPLTKDLIPSWFVTQVEAARAAGKPAAFVQPATAGVTRPVRGRPRKRIPAGRMSRTASSAASDGGDASPQLAQSAPSTPAGSPKFGPNFDGPGYTEIDEDLSAVPMMTLTLEDSVPMDVDRAAPPSRPSRPSPPPPAPPAPPASPPPAAAGSGRSHSNPPALRDLSGRHRKEYELMPAQVPGSWTDLPELPRPQDGPFDLPDVDVVEFRPADLQLFLALRTAEQISGIAGAPPPGDLGEPAADLRPSTPPAGIFHIGPKVRNLVEAGLGKSFRGNEYMRAAGALDDHVKQLQQRMRERRDAVQTAVYSPGTVKESVDVLICQVMNVIDDFGTLSSALGAVSGLCRGIYYTLEATLPVGHHWGALVEMLEIVDRMRILVGDCQSRFAELEGSQDPLRAEVKRVAALAESVRAQCVAMPDSCSRSVEPMLVALNNTLTQTMSDTRNAITSPLEQIVEVLERDGHLSTDDAERLGDLITAALRTLFGAAATEHTFESLAETLVDLDERVAELEEEGENRGEGGTGTASDVEEVQMADELGEASPRTAHRDDLPFLTPASSGNTLQRLATAVESLTARVSALELAERDPKPIAAAVQEYLDSQGVSAALLRTVAQMVGPEVDNK